MIDVYVFRGMGEPRSVDGVPQGMLSDITRRLPPSRFRCYEPDWPAQIGPATGGVSLNSSVRAGADVGIDLARRSPNLVGLIGYSLGGLVVSEILARAESGDPRYRNPDGSQLQFAFVCNVSNPARAAGQSVGNLCPPTYFGLNGAHRRWPKYVNPKSLRRREMLVLEYANPADIITNAHPLSPARRINDLIEPLSMMEGLRLGNPGQQVNAAAYATWLMAEQAYRNPAMLGVPLNEAARGLLAYLRPFPSEHTCYSVRNMPGQNMTYTQHAAATLNRHFGEGGAA